MGARASEPAAAGGPRAAAFVAGRDAAASSAPVYIRDVCPRPLSGPLFYRHLLVTNEEPKDRSKGAFWLNVFLPGAGFLYLRRWKLAALNLAGALAFGLVIALLTGGRDLGIFSSSPAIVVWS